jgi:phosphatidylserine/phosphatidylglycerophosphate/cardiolipin synthase-like enzyme
MILDEEIVITGSYNWTMAAEKDNSENLLVIRDPHLARLYTAHWQRHVQHSFRYRATVSWRVRLRHWLVRLKHYGGRLRPWTRASKGMNNDGCAQMARMSASISSWRKDR